MSPVHNRIRRVIRERRKASYGPLPTPALVVLEPKLASVIDVHAVGDAGFAESTARARHGDSGEVRGGGKEQRYVCLGQGVRRRQRKISYGQRVVRILRWV